MSERQNSQNEIQFQKGVLEAQHEASIDGILVVSPEGKIISYNQRFIELWKLTKEVVDSGSDELALKSVMSSLENPQEFMERVGYLYAHPEEKSFEEIKLIDGRVFDRYSSPIRGSDSCLYGRIWFFRDITERIQAQSKILEQQRVIVASSRMSSLGEMAGGIAHEINNPLAVIKAVASQVKDILEEDQEIKKELLKELFSKIEDTTDRIAKIVSGMRFFCRDGQNDPFETVSLPTIIDSTVSLCGEKFKQNQVDLVIEVPPEGLTLDCRPTQISQVLLNLLNNAYDAIASLEQKWIKINVAAVGPQIELRVTDSGSGVTKELREKIFQPFFTTKELGKGTGLGLSLSKGIVESHLGKLELDTTSPHTCFVIRVPKKNSKTVRKSTAA